MPARVASGWWVRNQISCFTKNSSSTVETHTHTNECNCTARRRCRRRLVTARRRPAGEEKSLRPEPGTLKATFAPLTLRDIYLTGRFRGAKRFGARGGDRDFACREGNVPVIPRVFLGLAGCGMYSSGARGTNSCSSEGVSPVLYGQKKLLRACQNIEGGWH
jgi:hypothetical protein